MVLYEPESLLRIAIADLETAEASSDPPVFREGAWGFWLQQAVEKAIKDWLLQLGGDLPLTHDLAGCCCCPPFRQPDMETTHRFFTKQLSALQ